MIKRTGSSAPLTEGATNVAAALTDGEMVLKAAASTAAGIYSAVFVISLRLLLETGSDSLSEVVLDRLNLFHSAGGNE